MIWAWVLGCALPTDFCERQAAWVERCAEAAVGDDGNVCRRSIRACTEADLAVLDTYADCLDRTDCSSEAYFGCAASLQDLGDPRCGFGGE